MSNKSSTSKDIEIIIRLESDGLSHLNNSRFMEAINCFEQVAVTHPGWEHGQNFYNLACAYEENGELEKAELNYLRSISYEPNDEVRWSALAGLIYMQGQFERAKDLFLKVKNIANQSGDKSRVLEVDSVIENISKNLKRGTEKGETP